MSYQIRMGIPEMEEFWNTLCKKAQTNSLKGTEIDLFKQLVKALRFLENDPRHPGLKSHEITTLSKRYGMKVWQSYLETKRHQPEGCTGCTGLREMTSP